MFGLNTRAYNKAKFASDSSQIALRTRLWRMATPQPQKSPNVAPFSIQTEDVNGKIGREKNRNFISKRSDYGTSQGNHRGGKMNREVAVSKALSKLLRHSANDVGLKLDSEAYAQLDHVLEWQRLRSLHVTFTDIQNIVKADVKQRFSMKRNPALVKPLNPESTNPSEWVIRANQGHSIKIDSAKMLIPITDENGNIPEIAVHGTYHCFYNSIIESGGLRTMTRNHIHFSDRLQGDGQKVVSGMRNDAELLIYADVRASLKDGILWWKSDNGVLLTEGNCKGLLPVKYFQKVISKNNEIGLLMENGIQIKKLPESQEYKKPVGKTQKVNIEPRKILSKTTNLN